MNVYSFLMTAAVSLVAGIGIGVLGREILTTAIAFYRRLYDRPRYLQPYQPDRDNDRG